jgi:1-pyrroline-5-carboxylate dehydrogenase
VGAHGAALVDEIESLPVGDVRDFRNFMGAVINESAFRSQPAHIERRAVRPARAGDRGRARGRLPAVVRAPDGLIRAEDPRYESMCEEIFGPVVDRPRLSGPGRRTTR